MLKRWFERGQSLLETTIALGVLLVAVTLGAGAVLALTASEHSSQARLIALDAAGDATTELLAATAYDPAAPAHVAAAHWNSGAIQITSSVRSVGQARIVGLHYAGPGASGDLSLTLRTATLPPGSVVDANPAPGAR
jgi:Tfp pilus assembly protein PilV